MAHSGYKPGKDHANYRHGMASSKPYRSWQGIVQRCYNPKDAAFKDYGGRGIVVCERWRYDFAPFWEDMGPTYQPGLTIERDDFDKGYEPGNCRWVPKAFQSKNRRTVVIIDTPWGNLTLPEAAERVGMSAPAFWRRYKLGWRGDRLFSTPEIKGARVRPLTREHLESIGKPRPKKS